MHTLLANNEMEARIVTMKQKRITSDEIERFQSSMYRNEKACATIKKYVHEIELLQNFLAGRCITKMLMIEYRKTLQKDNQAQTVNGKLSAINAFLDFMNMPDCKMKLLRVQRKAFIEENRELSEAEYKRLLVEAKAQKNERLYHVMLTIAGTGIRISELQFITVEAVLKGMAEIRLKGKCRTVLLPANLKIKLTTYAKSKGIRQGYLFRTRNGKPLDRSNICHDMKKLCKSANINADKVFPHNFRHLFARTFYKIEKNLAHLADILGHSSIETTRIYVAASAKTYEQTLSSMRLII